MLVIRKEQMEAMSQYMLKGFEDRMVVHLNDLFPEACEALGEPTVRETIQYAVQQAKHYDIVAESDVCLYLDLMFVFGRDFDKNPELPWATEILTDRGLDDSSAKMNRLYDMGMEHQDEGKGILGES